MLASIKEFKEFLKSSKAKEEAQLVREDGLVGLRSWGKVTGDCPENLKAGLQ
jgi:hypothetical protein